MTMYMHGTKITPRFIRLCGQCAKLRISMLHDDVIKWKHFPRYWSFVREIHRAPHKGQWRGTIFVICAWINDWVNNGEAVDLRRHRTHYDVTVMEYQLHIIVHDSKGILVIIDKHFNDYYLLMRNQCLFCPTLRAKWIIDISPEIT